MSREEAKKGRVVPTRHEKMCEKMCLIRVRAGKEKKIVKDRGEEMLASVRPDFVRKDGPAL